MRIRTVKRQFEQAFGVEVVESRHALAGMDWLAAHSEARAADLMEFLQDPAIQGIVSTIGGDDSVRLLPFLDYSVIRQNPKVFLGYSDATVPHFVFSKAGVISSYGPSELNFTSLPVITRMDFGHTDPKFTLPIGVVAEIDCDVRQICLVESPTIW